MKTGPSPEKKNSFICREDSSSGILLQQVATTRKKPGVCSTPPLREHTTTSMFDEVRGDEGYLSFYIFYSGEGQQADM